MSSLRERLDRLEEALTAPDGQISVYHDVPLAIFRYDPDEELALRTEVALLAVRLTQRHGKEVVPISLAELLDDAVAQTVGGWEALAAAEEATSLETAIDTVTAILDQMSPLDDRIAGILERHDPARSVALLTRAGALFPCYRMSSLLERLVGRVRVPTVLFYPGTLSGSGLSFMGVLEPHHGYRPTIF